MTKCNRCKKIKPGSLVDTDRTGYFGEVVEAFLCFDCIDELEEELDD